jgi:hypothetical protein
VLDSTSYDKVCQLVATGRWFFPGTPVSPPNETDRHDITEILLKVALNTITQVQRENHRPAASHRQTLPQNVVSNTPRHERGSNSQLQW